MPTNADWFPVVNADWFPVVNADWFPVVSVDDSIEEMCEFAVVRELYSDVTVVAILGDTEETSDPAVVLYEPESLRKHAYSNTLKIHHQKMTNFQIKYSDIFHFSAQNIDCGYSLEPPRRGGSNEYPQSVFLSRNNKNNVYPCKPQFYYIKVGFKGVKII